LVEQLKQAINDSGKSLNQLGHAAGVSPGQLSRFVRGERNLSLEVAEKICRALRLRLSPDASQPEEQPPAMEPRKPEAAQEASPATARPEAVKEKPDAPAGKPARRKGKRKPGGE
jgi:transcriptional regulator with XRE-family HTH domain